MDVGAGTAWYRAPLVKDETRAYFTAVCHSKRHHLTSVCRHPLRMKSDRSGTRLR